MAKQVFDTSLKCEGCVNSVRKGLNELLGEEQWSVDLNAPVKTLEVSSDIKLEELSPIFERVGHSIKNQA